MLAGAGGATVSEQREDAQPLAKAFSGAVVED
jgi:hypothetical protein